MTQARRPKPIASAGGWLALAFVLTLFGMLLTMAVRSGEMAELLIGLPGLAWLTAPIVGAWAFVGASPTRTGALGFLALELGLIGSVVWVYLVTMSSSTGSLALAVWPVYQWGAILLAFMLALALGWRMRPDFLKVEV
jgi:hypothetical protein